MYQNYPFSCSKDILQIWIKFCSVKGQEGRGRIFFFLVRSYLKCIFYLWHFARICKKLTKRSFLFFHLYFSKLQLFFFCWAVSGLHARLDKKDGMLLVTDLDSTNGTFINEKKLRPGAVTPVLPGSILIFGIWIIILTTFLVAFCGFSLIPSILGS